jgi:hypothetical protein
MGVVIEDINFNIDRASDVITDDEISEAAAEGQKQACA